jgi:PKD repeat protein
VPGLLSIKTSDQGPQYYYYFFDWEVDFWSPCGRTPVPVYINQPITANVSYSPPLFNLLKDEKVEFQDITSGAALWLWDFDDGTTSSQQNPVHSYSGFERVYDIELNVADTGNACKDSITFQYEVISGAEDVVFPNPSTGMFLIDLGISHVEDISVSMYDAAGKRMFEGWSFRVEDAFLEVDLSALSDGAYIIDITFKDRRSAERLLKLSN